MLYSTVSSISGLDVEGGVLEYLSHDANDRWRYFRLDHLDEYQISIHIVEGLSEVDEAHVSSNPKTAAWALVNSSRLFLLLSELYYRYESRELISTTSSRSKSLLVVGDETFPSVNVAVSSVTV